MQNIEKKKKNIHNLEEVVEESKTSPAKAAKRKEPSKYSIKDLEKIQPPVTITAERKPKKYRKFPDMKDLD